MRVWHVFYQILDGDSILARQRTYVTNNGVTALIAAIQHENDLGNPYEKFVLTSLYSGPDVDEVLS